MKGALRLSTIPLLLALSACTANPGPPPIVEEETTTTTSTTAPAPAARSEVRVGVAPLRNGLNPHLAADENATVHDIAELTLPSVFVRQPEGEWLLNTDVVVSADIVPDTEQMTEQMTVRYQINPAAQWSDGSPLTGADFVYLWRGMVSTPGTVDPAAYRAISDVQVSGSGKTVDVVFAEPVQDWQSLFTHLLPSHLLDSNAGDFATALASSIPASAGRYMVNSVDHGAGVIVLNRNDRFWGENPAGIDILTLATARSTDQVADRLRSGQYAFVDHVPGETSLDTYSLIPDTQVTTYEGPRELGVTMSVVSPILRELPARQSLASLIDVPLISRIASGRNIGVSSASAASRSSEVGEVDAGSIPASESRRLRIAADPRDSEAMQAARAIVDVLNGRGIPAETIAADMTDIAKRLAEGEVDAVVGWSLATTPSAWASEIQCPADDAGYAGNLSGLCMPETESLAADILSGAIGPDNAGARVTSILQRESVWLPLLREERIVALGTSLEVPALIDEPAAALTAAPSWVLRTPAGTLEKEN